MTRKKVVYVAMCADLVHTGHLKIIREAGSFGDVVVGLLTDEAVATYKRVPFMEYEHRREVVENLKGVSSVVRQDTLDYRPNLRRIRPDVVIHGTDWRDGVMSDTREQVIDTIAEWGGELIEPEYTDGISSSQLIRRARANGLLPETRQRRLSRCIAARGTILALEAHNGLSASVVEATAVSAPSGRPAEFDAIWVSSLTDSVAKGKPDTEVVDMTSRLATVNEILDVTTKPLIVDCDTGSHPDHFVSTVRTLERLGVSAAVIEDKIGRKRNSLHHDASVHVQDDANAFSAKIRAGVDARAGEHFLVVARIESLVTGAGLNDALDRAAAYIDAGAGAIMVSSKSLDGIDVKEFAAAYTTFETRRPLVVVPTSYCAVTDGELSAWGANVIVYANHMLRAAYPAMQQVAQMILRDGRAHDAESLCTPVADLIEPRAESPAGSKH